MPRGPACPRCQGKKAPRVPGRSPLESGASPGVLVPEPPGFECRSCGGLWVARKAWTEFVAACERREKSRGDSAAAAAPIASRRDSIESRLCPECRRYMSKQNFARLSGVRVDVCYRHGVWLDAGELAAVRAFIVKGGLRLSRQLAREQRKDEFHRWEELWRDDGSGS